MKFRIADTFNDSLNRLTGEEQKVVKTTAFDLQMNPANPGMSFHKLENTKDKNFWSVRVSSDIRLIIHRTASSLLLCYVDHHDRAYQWAERRKLETHPKTGAAQLVEIRETVKEIFIPVYLPEESATSGRPAIFADVCKEELLSYGVPEEWIGDIQKADEDSLLKLTDYLPSEAAEALLELATGGSPQIQTVTGLEADPFEHPDAQRRFRIMSNSEELALALDYPWEKWTIFLHPAQRQIVEKDYNGPFRVSGSAGTGKTIVELHRAVYLARKNPEARVLLTTFSDTLADALQIKLRRLISNEPRLAERLEVCSIDSIGERLYEAHFAPAKIASKSQIKQFIKVESDHIEGLRFSPRFLMVEWEEVVDAWQLNTWEEYRNVERLGRKTRLSEQQRSILWSIFEKVKANLCKEGLLTRAQMFNRLAEQITERRHPPFEFAVIDEAQDVNVPQLLFLAALGGERSNSLFFAGDLGQRIFQTPFSWKSLGVDIRGRSQTLRINYRTSHQIRMQADRLLDPKIADVDGNIDDRRGTVSVFNGPNPTIQVFKTIEEESEAVAEWLKKLCEEGVESHEIGLFVRSSEQFNRALEAARKSGLQFKILDEHVKVIIGQMSICSMHLAKGLEFRAVAVMACDDEIIPLQERIELVADNSDLEEVYDTERHLLYVACTRRSRPSFGH